MEHFICSASKELHPFKGQVLYGGLTSFEMPDASSNEDLLILMAVTMAHEAASYASLAVCNTALATI